MNWWRFNFSWLAGKSLLSTYETGEDSGIQFCNQCGSTLGGTYKGKFKLGAIQSLRQALKAEKIGFTVINPGNVATDEVLMDIEEGNFKEQIPIPISDIILTAEMILSLSKNVEVGDINLVQKDG
jgi:hypothetical protein